MFSVTADIQPKRGPLDGEIASLARRQYGIVRHAQLIAIGCGEGAIRHRLAVGRLHSLHRGVYAVGHDLIGRDGRMMAAVFACGPRAVLSHRTAAEHWNLIRMSGTRIDVTAHRGCRAKRGIALHKPRCMPPADTTVHERIPVTTVARTLLDFASVARPGELVRALEQAERLGLFDLAAIQELLARSRGRRGAAALRAALRELGVEAPDTRSPLEERFVHFCRRRRLPPPALNVVVAGLCVDAAWPSLGVVVELDSRKHHLAVHAFEEDRKRDTKLQIAGFAIVRVTDQRLERESDELEADLRSLLQ